MHRKSFFQTADGAALAAAAQAAATRPYIFLIPGGSRQRYAMASRLGC